MSGRFWLIFLWVWACVLPPGTSTADEGRTLRERAVELAFREWRIWGRQRHGPVRRRGHREAEPEFAERVRAYYWRATGRQLDDVTRVGWSSTFISWAFYHASNGAGERYRGPHFANIVRAFRARRTGEAARFVAYESTEAAPRVGDLVCAIQQAGVDLDNLPGRFRSHCDIVVRIREGAVDIIGGNVSDSVSMRTLRTDAAGRVIPVQRRRVDPSVREWSVIIRVNG